MCAFLSTMVGEKQIDAAIVSDNTTDNDPERYFQGYLPVYAGRFRRKIVGYFDGHIPPGTRVGREIRLVKLPALTWVYGHLIATDDGPAIYVPSASMMDSIEGFHPIRSGKEIRTTPKSELPSGPSLDNQLISDAELANLTDIVIVELDALIEQENP